MEITLSMAEILNSYAKILGETKFQPKWAKSNRHREKKEERENRRAKVSDYNGQFINT